MRLLLTNDDGVHAKGIYALCKELEQYHDIVVVAPEDQKSASSHSITVRDSLIVREVTLPELKSKAFSVSGTPADCVRIALNHILDEPVDMVVSGINVGFNLGIDVLYSGTVSAAVEATLCSIPAVAVSTFHNADLEVYHTAAKYINKILEQAVEHHIQKDMVLNVNVPPIEEQDIKGIKVCRISDLQYQPYYKEMRNEKGELYYRLEGEKIKKYIEETDAYYVNQGYISVTPLHYDLTNFNILKDVKKWF